MLVLTRTIARHELKPLDRFLTFHDVLEGARKVYRGLGIEVKPPSSLSRIRFYKIRIGKKNNARMIIFMQTENNKMVPVLIRLKKDKIFGMNMSMNNSAVIAQINKNLVGIFDDIRKKDYQEFSL